MSRKAQCPRCRSTDVVTVKERKNTLLSVMFGGKLVIKNLCRSCGKKYRI